MLKLDEDTQSYHRCRAKEEFDRARQAKNRCAAVAHFELFNLHVACFLLAKAADEEARHPIMTLLKIDRAAPTAGVGSAAPTVGAGLEEVEQFDAQELYECAARL